MIKAQMTPKSGKKSKKVPQEKVTEYLTTISKLEKVDRPNLLLFKARMQAYLVESVDTTEQFGKHFEDLLEDYPSFIDGYIAFWKYLKFRLVQLQGRSFKNPERNTLLPGDQHHGDTAGMQSRHCHSSNI